MPFWTCEQCGAQFPESRQPPPCCPVCEDDRQFVNWRGQRWLSRDELAKGHRLGWRDDCSLVGIGVEPSFAIGQRALLIPDGDGCVMWDCVPLVTAEAVDYVKSVGGLRAIAVSHPHYYGAIADWSEAFGNIPVYLHHDDGQWITRPHASIVRGAARRSGFPMIFSSCAPAGILPVQPCCIGAPVPMGGGRC